MRYCPQAYNAVNTWSRRFLDKTCQINIFAYTAKQLTSETVKRRDSETVKRQENITNTQRVVAQTLGLQALVIGLRSWRSRVPNWGYPPETAGDCPFTEWPHLKTELRCLNNARWPSTSSLVLELSLSIQAGLLPRDSLAPSQRRSIRRHKSNSPPQHSQ